MTLFSRKGQSSMGITHSLVTDPEYSQVECPHNQILNEIYLGDILFRETPSLKKKNQIFRVDSGMLSAVSLGVSEGETIPTTLFSIIQTLCFL
jgi:hypothetical protein